MRPVKNRTVLFLVHCTFLLLKSLWQAKFSPILTRKNLIIMKATLNCILIGSLLFFVSAAAQQQPEYKNLFIRIYNAEGAKTSKGKLVNISEEGIVLKRGQKTVSIALAEIAKIKTKRALGHNMGIGAMLGATAGAIIGASTGSSIDNFFDDVGSPEKTNFDTAGMATFGLLGGAIGTATGALTGVSKKPITFDINGQKNELLKFREVMLKVFH